MQNLGDGGSIGNGNLRQADVHRSKTLLQPTVHFRHTALDH
ncbi:hypothetical protein XOCgx_2143 [Xanthomonas oryzae pv. oryzicola]|nr:hypothetical protein XOCgx_2143 [Xanthomonas oryzae pv. oryzicola]